MKTSFAEKLKSLFSKGSNINDEFYEDLTDMLVEGDIGAKAAFEIAEELEKLGYKLSLTKETVNE